MANGQYLVTQGFPKRFWEPTKHVPPMANLPDGLELLGLQDKILSADAAPAVFYGGLTTFTRSDVQLRSVYRSLSHARATQRKRNSFLVLWTEREDLSVGVSSSG